MTNVTTHLNGTVLTLTVDLAQRNGPSKSGKTQIVASTNGSVKVGEYSIGLNVWTK